MSHHDDEHGTTIFESNAKNGHGVGGIYSKQKDNRIDHKRKVPWAQIGYTKKRMGLNGTRM